MDIKTILQLNKEADARDLPYIDTIKGQLVTLIDSTTLAETEYKATYDISTVIGSLGDLQKERIRLKIGNRLRDLAYQATFDGDILTITWTIATLSQPL